MTAPTIGSNVEEFTHKNVNFVMWDIGGQESSRVAWSTYYQGTNVIMLLIDSTDRERLDVVGTELNRILAHEVIIFTR